MTSERVQRRIDGLLDQAESAADRLDWEQVAQCVRMVLRIEPDNADALVFQTMLEGEVREDPAREVPAGKSGADMPGAPDMPPDAPGGETEPTSFAGGRYQVSKFLGEGGKKRVYQAHDTLLDREVAFALIKTEGFDETSKERISREAQAMGRLGVHPNIVAVLDLGQEDDGTPYMVTELMGGGDVEGLLAETTPEPPPESGGGKLRPPPREGGGLEVGRDLANVPAASARAGLPLDRTIEIGKAVCEGLEFAHARGIVHRDLKPGNVWLTEDGIAKIGDFGLAVMTDRSRLTREGMMVGTVSYMPPEQATGGEITPKADLYSLGAMLYEMVTGRPPFLGDDEIAIIGQHINTPPVAPTWHNGDCPRPLEALVMRLLAKDPSERPDSAQDVYNALDAIDLAARGDTVEREGTSLESLAGDVFVGRQAEMDQLKAALEDVLGGRGRLLTSIAEPGIGKFRNERRLTDAEIELIGKWAAAGAPEGDSGDLPRPPEFTEGWQLGEPDLIVKMAEPFSIPAGGKDIYRCFVIPLEIEKDMMVSAVEFRPGNRRVVHHSIMFLDAAGAARKLAGKDGQPGYESFGGPGVAATGGLGAWVPGLMPRLLPDGLGRFVKQGSDLVLQVHYHPTGKPEKDQSSVGIYFCKKPVKRIVSGIAIVQPDLKIPAGRRYHSVRAESEP
ncbi:MAG: protein kinase, partial [Chloroflexi bacterium]|nr:protein kinase [Chloroflexota bacterium]